MKRKLILYIATSFDHFIARSNGDISWLELPDYVIEGDDYGYQDLLNSVDTTLMGHTTYKILKSFDMPFPYPDKTNYVFSTRNDLENTEYVSFISENIASFVGKLKNQEGKNIWLIGGGKINQILLNYNLIDEMIITVMPIMLGHSVKLFHGVVKEKKLLLTHAKHYKNGVLQLHYIR